MSKAFSHLVLQVGLFLGCASIASALPSDAWFNKSRNKTGGERYYSPEAGFSQGVGRKGAMDDMRWAVPGADPSARCTEEECPEIATIPLNVSGSVKRGISVVGSMRSHADTMGSVAYASQQSTYLGLPWATLDIMYEYLDSGVAGGLFKAYNKASGALSNRFAALNTVLTQIALIPEIRSVAAGGFLGCLNKAQTGDGSGAKSFLAATDTCLEDQSQPSAANFSESGQTAPPNWMGVHFDAPEGHPNSTTLYLSDLLIEPIRRQLEGMSESPDPNHPLPVPSQLKENFQRYFGDKIYTMPVTQRGMPKTPTEAISRPTLPPEKLESQLFYDSWTQLHELLRGYCEFNRKSINHQAQNHAVFPYEIVDWEIVYGFPFPIFGPSTRDFWRNIGEVYPNGSFGPSAQTIISLSTSTFGMNDVIGDALFSLFVKTQDISTGAGASADHPLNFKCDILKSKNAGDGSYFDEISADPQQSALPWRSMITRLARLIAAGRRLDLYVEAMSEVYQWTAASKNASQLRDEATSLMDIVTGGSAEEMNKSLSVSVSGYVKELLERKQVETGALGSQIPAAVSGGSGRGTGSLTGS